MQFLKERFKRVTETLAQSYTAKKKLVVLKKLKFEFKLPNQNWNKISTLSLNFPFLKLEIGYNGILFFRKYLRSVSENELLDCLWSFSFVLYYIGIFEAVKIQKCLTIFNRNYCSSRILRMFNKTSKPNSFTFQLRKL